MKEVFEYLQQESILPPFYNGVGNLVFQLSNINIIFYIKDDSGINVDNFADYNDSLFVTIDDVDNVVIQKSIPLDDIASISEMRQVTYPSYCIVSLLSKKFHGCVRDFHVGDVMFDDRCYMCDQYSEYGVQIHLTSTVWDKIEFYRYVLSLNFQFGESPFIIKEPLRQRDCLVVKTLPSNTKTRRIGYLKILLQYLTKNSQVSSIRLLRGFEEYCAAYRSSLLCYHNIKGEVSVTKTGNSASPYVELAQKLGLINKVSNYYQIGKRGKTYMILKDRIDGIESSGNPFILSEFDVSFFMEIFLREDFPIISTILSLILLHENISYSEMKLIFQESLYRKAERYIEKASEYDSNKISALIGFKQRVLNWEKPNSYLEHVLMPRINWLLDLRLVTLDTKLNISLTAQGRTLLNDIMFFCDSEGGELVSSDSMIDTYYMRIMDDVIGPRNNMAPLINKESINYLEECFGIFKTLAPNRVTFSQTELYVRQLMYWEKSFCYEKTQLTEFLKSEYNTDYIFLFQNQYNDGYIQKRK